jgi:hypothetical protein
VTLYGDKWLVVINESCLQSSVSALQCRLSLGTIIFTGLGVCGSYRSGQAHTRDSGYRRGAIGVSLTCLKVVMRLYLDSLLESVKLWKGLCPTAFGPGTLWRGGPVQLPRAWWAYRNKPRALYLRLMLVSWTGAPRLYQRTWVVDVFSNAVTTGVAEPHRPLCYCGGASRGTILLTL